mgnify:CR=1 FL=1
MQNQHSIDLHGIRHGEVKNLLIRKIEDLWDSNTKLEIITGHSSKMKNIVIETLYEYKLPYEDGTFFNKGIIITDL